MGPTWVMSAPDGPHVDHMNLAIKVAMYASLLLSAILAITDQGWTESVIMQMIFRIFHLFFSVWHIIWLLWIYCQFWISFFYSTFHVLSIPVLSVAIVNISDFISFRQFSWQHLVILLREILDFLPFTLIISHQVSIVFRAGFTFESTFWNLLEYIMNEIYFDPSSQCHVNLIITIPIANSSFTTKSLEYDLAWYC